MILFVPSVHRLYIYMWVTHTYNAQLANIILPIVVSLALEGQL